MNLKIEFSYEEDGRWIAEVIGLPVNGVCVYGTTQADATRKVKILALQVIADLIEHEEMPEMDNIHFLIEIPHVA